MVMHASKPGNARYRPPKIKYIAALAKAIEEASTPTSISGCKSKYLYEHLHSLTWVVFSNVYVNVNVIRLTVITVCYCKKVINGNMSINISNMSININAHNFVNLKIIQKECFGFLNDLKLQLSKSGNIKIFN